MLPLLPQAGKTSISVPHNVTAATFYSAKSRYGQDLTGLTSDNSTVVESRKVNREYSIFQTLETNIHACKVQSYFVNITIFE